MVWFTYTRPPSCVFQIGRGLGRIPLTNFASLYTLKTWCKHEGDLFYSLRILQKGFRSTMTFKTPPKRASRNVDPNSDVLPICSSHQKELTGLCNSGGEPHHSYNRVFAFCGDCSRRTAVKRARPLSVNSNACLRAIFFALASCLPRPRLTPSLDLHSHGTHLLLLNTPPAATIIASRSSLLAKCLAIVFANHDSFPFSLLTP